MSLPKPFDLIVFIAFMNLLLWPAAVRQNYLKSKRDVQYARRFASGDLTLLEEHDDPSTGFAGWIFLPTNSINHTRASIKVAAQKRKLLRIWIAIFIGILCVDYYFYYTGMSPSKAFDIWKEINTTISPESLLGYSFSAAVFILLVGSPIIFIPFVLWTTALQAFWIYQLSKYEPGTIVAVPLVAKVEKDIGLVEKARSDLDK